MSEEERTIRGSPEEQEIPSDHQPTKEPSFHGRLHLQDFIYNKGGMSHLISPRRSPRILASSSSSAAHSFSVAGGAAITSSDVRSSNVTGLIIKPAPSPSPSPSPAKRKSRSNTILSPSKGSGSSSPSTTTTITTKSPSPNKRPRKNVPASYAPPSTYAHLPLLPDAIAPNLLVLFIGLNPGVQTARTGHAYAHPSNLFWKLLYSSGLTPVPCKPEEDVTLPARFSLGNTNIVARPSRNGAELSKSEMDDGVAVLEEKCRRWKPEVVCVVGKSIWESIFRVRRGRNMNKSDGFTYGWQEGERMGVIPSADDADDEEEVLIKEENGNGDDTTANREPWEGSKIFVATSTSGLAATLRPEEKERIWKVLGDWCVQRRKQRALAAEEDGSMPKIKMESH
ncbi:DNA glycosylase [Xylariaceae sp. FL0255]|nr:DNA glycosylase [Xylariaceae sp. FL0255]